MLDPEALRSDATDNFDVYGYWGISVFAEVGGVDLSWIAAHKLARANWLVLFRVGDVLASGLGVVGYRPEPPLRCGQR